MPGGKLASVPNAQFRAHVAAVHRVCGALRQCCARLCHTPLIITMAAAVESVGAAAVAGVSEADLKGIVQLAKQHASRGGDSGGEGKASRARRGAVHFMRAVSCSGTALQGNLQAKGAYTFILELLAQSVREKLDAETLTCVWRAARTQSLAFTPQAVLQTTPAGSPSASRAHRRDSQGAHAGSACPASTCS